MIRVLIVEDSQVEQQLLSHILGADAQIAVIGCADDGEKALLALEELQPDVITMDIHMPRLNGFATTRRIMESKPLPVIIVSGSYQANDAGKTFRALEAGALAIVRKPSGPGHSSYQKDAAELVRTVKMMSEIKVVKRWPQPCRGVPAPPLAAAGGRITPEKIKVVAIGASTGGPTVIQEIFTALPKDLVVPVLVVQHMATGFMDHFVQWLSSTSGFPCHLASHGAALRPGHAYFAPDGYHLLTGRDRSIVLSDMCPEHGLRPSVARLFHSVAENYGDQALGILLTGMGRDGADDLKLLQSQGSVTIAQDQESSIIFGMPGEAIKLAAADFILPPEGIVQLLARLSRAGNDVAGRGRTGERKRP
jgi:two-component system chemotaxis response regulator CheB